MNIQLIEKGAKRRLAAVAAIVIAVSQLLIKLALPWFPMYYLIALGIAFGAMAFAVLATRVEVGAWWGMLVEQLCVAAASAFILHLPMFEYAHVVPLAFIYSTAVAMVLQLVFGAIFGSCKWFGAFWLTVCWIYGIVTIEVFLFTGNLITLSQILSVQTGINVLGSYRFVFAPFILSSTILYALAMIGLMRAREVRLGRRSVRLAALACAAAVAVVPVRGVMTSSSRTYKDNALRESGITMELLLEWKAFKVQPPEGYSEEAVAKLAEYAPAEAADAADGEPVHVIAIMIEAFSDLNVLGDLELNVDPLAYTRSLADESIHGFYLCSTLGSGTSRSEWEFLTGNSMHFVPYDSIPYRQYLEDDENSLVQLFENQGYQTIGMHPFEGSGWDRYLLYPMFGFDDIYFEPDLEWDGYERSYVSDSAMFHQIIRLFEDRDRDRPLFFFGVTMQDHGGYTNASFVSDVHILNLDGDCSQADQYLSLIKKTDDAIRELIEYFRGVDEKVEIVFFGDHQPGFKQDFYTMAGTESSVQKFLVPYVIWKNFDDTAEETGLTSANYLGLRAMQEAGLELPAYFGFLAEAQKTLPAICGLGYQYDGQIYLRGDEANEDVGALLNEYAVYEYANMFDDGVDKALFEGAPSESENKEQ